MTSGAGVHLVDLHRAYGGVPALDGLDLRVEPGELVSLLGPSGCGKTTALRVLGGLETVDRGQVLVGDKDVTGVPAHRRDMGMVFQAYSLFPHLTVLDNVAFGLKLRGRSRSERRARAGDMLDLVGLGTQKDRYANQLSGGQQQRVAAARALASRPQIVFADEPTGALDSKSGSELLAFLRKAVKELGQTVVMVTHDPVAASYADRVIFLADGKIVDEMADPTADSVLDSMKRLGA